MSYSTEATALLVLLRATECMSCLLSCLCGSRYGSRFLFDGRTEFTFFLRRVSGYKQKPPIPRT